MTFPPRSSFQWQLRTRSLALGPRTLLMGILNVTPDSFSDGNRFVHPQTALHHALHMLDEGADIIDLGGESTRPNATAVAHHEEQARILPVLRAILATRPTAIVSVDTYHASTATRALDCGAEIVNDVSGLLWDAEMAGVLARNRPGVILMHTRGRPTEWHALAPLAPHDVLPVVLSGLTHTLQLGRAAGLPDEHILLDPGFGFGKRGEENFTLLARLAQLQALGRPLLAGVSRKRFLTAARDNPAEEARLHATIAANTAAILAGAHLLRVHDVAAARAAADVADALLAASASAL